MQVMGAKKLSLVWLDVKQREVERSVIRGRVSPPEAKYEPAHTDTQVHLQAYDMTDRPADAHMHTYMLECTH